MAVGEKYRVPQTARSGWPREGFSFWPAINGVVSSDVQGRKAHVAVRGGRSSALLRSAPWGQSGCLLEKGQGGGWLLKHMAGSWWDGRRDDELCPENGWNPKENWHSLLLLELHCPIWRGLEPFFGCWRKGDRGGHALLGELCLVRPATCQKAHASDKLDERFHRWC